MTDPLAMSPEEGQRATFNLREESDTVKVIANNGVDVAWQGTTQEFAEAVELLRHHTGRLLVRVLSVLHRMGGKVGRHRS